MTFKAFRLLDSVHAALDLVCRVTGTTSPRAVAMQMIVFECRTGTYVDIDGGGFVHDYIRKHLAASRPAFTPVIEEINVHALVAWTGVDRLYTALLHAPAPAFLVDLDLTLSVTRLGTVLLRFCLRAPGPAREYDGGMEAATLAVADALHRVFCVFPGA